MAPQELMLTRILTTIILLIVPVQAQESSTWQRYSAQGFSVLLPYWPPSMEVSLPSGIMERQRTAWLATSYENDVAYIVFATNKRDDALSRFVNEVDAFTTRPTKVDFDRELSGKDFTGKQYRLITNNGVLGIVRFYVTKSKVYILLALGVDQETAPVRTFLDSFSVGNEPTAIDLSDSLEKPAPPALHTATDVKNFSGKDVTTKARVVFKPEPMYTEQARRYQTTGTVVLRAIFSSTGQVINIREMSGLPYGLTERAIAAARNIRFFPAVKDGKPVNMYIQLEYNFNLY